jgi:hypothetical protein
MSSCIRSPRPDFCYCETVASLFMWVALSNKWPGLPYAIAAGPRQRSHSRIPVPRDHILLSQICDSLNLEGQVSVFVSQMRLWNPAWVSEWVSYITTDGQSASLSWCQAPIWGLWPDFYYCQTIAGLLMWGALSGERSGLSFTMYNVRHGPHRNHRLQQFSYCCVRVYCDYRVMAIEPSPSNGSVYRTFP